MQRVGPRFPQYFMPPNDMNDTALGGMRVLDLTRVLAGPYSTLTLGDLGAEVVKVENPEGGDDTRHFQVSPKLGISTYFLAVNRNKKSVALDFRVLEGREALLDLAEQSDVLVENFRSGVTERAGIGYEDVSARNPKIVYCSISAYGRSGPFSGKPGYDPIVQAESGFMSLTGEVGGGPIRTGISIIDIITGMFASQAILAALIARDRIGRGQHIDVPLFDSAIGMLLNAGSRYLVDGQMTDRIGNSNAVAGPAGLFETADGQLMLATSNSRLFRVFCSEVLGRPEMGKDPRFAENSGRVANRDALAGEINAVFKTGSKAMWLQKMAEHGIPSGELRDVAEALASPEAKARNLTVTETHPEFGDIPGIRSPMHLSETPVRKPMAAPSLGAHTEVVLREVAGYDETRIAALRQAGAIPA